MSFGNSAFLFSSGFSQAVFTLSVTAIDWLYRKLYVFYNSPDFLYYCGVCMLGEIKFVALSP